VNVQDAVERVGGRGGTDGRATRGHPLLRLISLQSEISATTIENSNATGGVQLTADCDKLVRLAVFVDKYMIVQARKVMNFLLDLSLRPRNPMIISSKVLR
jgi:hypothetical protein